MRQLTGRREGGRREPQVSGGSLACENFSHRELDR
jgi:hypothetical protein